jgi:hypothetical protein
MSPSSAPILTLLLPLLPATALAGGTTYVRVPDAAATQAILDAAVEETVQQISWAFRGFARPKLQDVATSCGRYEIERADGGDQITWQCEDRPAITREAGSSATWTNREGKSFELSVTRTTEGQVEAWTADFRDKGGGKKITYRFLPDGGLEVVQEVYSSQLPQPMRWTVPYRAAE